MKILKKIATTALLGLVTTMVLAQTADLTLSLQNTGKTVSPDMYGIFFEDINFAADGGLYAEMVKNRSFEFPNKLQGWRAAGQFEVRNDGPFDRNPHYVRMNPSGHAHKYTALENDGYFGMGIKGGAEYRFSVWARTPQGGSAKMTIELCDPASNEESQVIVASTLTVDSKEWKKYTLILKPEQTHKTSTLRLFLDNQVAVDVEHVSLFPVDTWMGHENGMRKDLAQALYDLRPGVFRFPGGCIVEGADLASRYQWKNSVGPVENRPLNENRWESTFKYRFFPDYHQSYGLGFYEFFLLSEELGSEPLPVLSVGLACQFQNDSPDAHQPLDELDEFIQDAIDLIEFANGGIDTKWGKLRAEMGHPAPFNLKYLAIGNEQWDQIYIDYVTPFLEVIREKHPEIIFVGTSGPNSEGDQFDFLWPKMKELEVDMVDEHFYRPESWFLKEGSRYDNYDRKGPAVFAGEYACHGAGKKWNHYNASLLEAALMTGYERNADIVRLATYAPLFAHYDGWQWRPDLIWFDNFTTVKTCSYYVQQLYSKYKGTDVLDLTVNGKPLTGADGQNGLFASAVYDKGNNQVYVKVVNTSDKAAKMNLNITGLKKKESVNCQGTVTLNCADPLAENTRENPFKVVPVSSFRDGVAADGGIEVGPQTFKIFIFSRNN